MSSRAASPKRNYPSTRTTLFWKRLRLALFALFWVAWILMLLSAIIIILLAPRCPHRDKQSWWQEEVIYKVDVEAFLDSDSDGHGDLNGLESKLDYLSQIGVKAVWMTPIFNSSKQFDGYDANDFESVDARFGQLDQIRPLAKKMNKRGMHLIIDLVPNHSGKNHKWFQESLKSGSEYADYYIWRSQKPNVTGREPPNNWKNNKGESAWTWNDDRQMFYLHQFDASQPDLNYRNPKVVEEMNEVIRFWLNQGVDGIHISYPKYLFECPGFMDSTPEHDMHTFYNETFEMFGQWRSILDDVSEKTSRPRLLITDADGDKAVNYYDFKKAGAHVVISQQLLSLKDGTKASEINGWVKHWEEVVPRGRQQAWMVSNGNSSRLATRLGGRRKTHVDLANMLQMLLRGTAVVYYGDEIGMEDLSPSELAGTTSKSPRAAARSPMQWTGGRYAGFTKGNETFLPVGGNYVDINVETELAHGSGIGNLEFFSELTKLRSKESFLFGETYIVSVNEDVVSFVREAHGFEGYLVAFNMGSGTATVRFHEKNPSLIPEKATVALTTPNLDVSDLKKDLVVNTNQILLKGGQGIVFKWPGKEQKRLID